MILQELIEHFKYTITANYGFSIPAKCFDPIQQSIQERLKQETIINDKVKAASDILEGTGYTVIKI